MDNDTLVTVGTFCEEVLRHPAFEIVCSEFERSTCSQILATKPDHSRTRESVYQTFLGAQAFLALMKDFIRAKEQIVNPAADEYPDDLI